MNLKVAGAWKSLNSKIHPPLPMTARDSQQLLQLLNASFKQQLDRKHPAALSITEDHTDHHLQSILTNPLFNTKSRTRDTSTDKGQRIGQSLGQLHLQDHMKQPMDVFKKRVSEGTANLQTAKLCLGLQNKACMARSAATRREAMRTSGAASTILQWLWSSGLEDKGLFLDDRLFISLLMPFVVAEGQQSRISRWLQRSHRFGGNQLSSISGLDRDRIHGLFAKLVGEEIHIGDGLESAINLFLRTVADLRSSGLSGKATGGLAIPTAWLLIAEIIRLPKSKGPQPTLLNAFLKTTREITSSARAVLNATLCVYIQERPDPQPVVDLFHNISAKAIKYTGASRRAQVVRLGLRAAELLLQDGRQEQAFSIMKHLQTNFAWELGSPQVSQVATPVRPYKSPGPRDLRDEDVTLTLLDTLPV